VLTTVYINEAQESVLIVVVEVAPDTNFKGTSVFFNGNNLKLNRYYLWSNLS
jgi:hypothetical protein